MTLYYNPPFIVKIAIHFLYLHLIFSNFAVNIHLWVKNLNNIFKHLDHDQG